MSSKKPEDLTLDEIKEQMALYQRLYYYRTRDNPDMKESRKESKRRYYQKKKAEKEEQKNWKKRIVMNQHRKETTTENIRKILPKR